MGLDGFRCSGTMITPNYILTLAECLCKKNNEKFSELKLYNEDKNCTLVSKIAKVLHYIYFNITHKNIIMHEEFNYNSKDNNIGLVKLPQCFRESLLIPPFDYASEYLKFTQLPEKNINLFHQKIYGQSWSFTKADNYYMPVGQAYYSKIVPNNECKRLRNRKNKNQYFCAVGNNRNYLHNMRFKAMLGGSSLLKNTSIVVGLRLHQLKIDKTYAPFLNVVYFVNWIHNKTDNHGC